ncbi:TonB-dependent receptor plug domain-containing protein [Horticoccus luteus]|uniref:TonB-dependent receptor plug domain-containing protein n=1 Tax=Horticoccus luteus TaxID=2862869 RepID=A0A8F9TUG4_9BACT|nr:TonB-dependent receptor plug domain-containing protein [Horticoccus luteus]QYM77792.1 TonB-dependent receptor plug domain-containing protein [Horticoccus luteus]
MNPKKLHSNRPRRSLGLGFGFIFLIALLANPLRAQESLQSIVDRLEAENAALRSENAKLRHQTPPAETPAAAPASPRAVAPAESPANTTASSSRSLPTDSGVTVMSAFEVRSDRDHGYLKTNAATATRIGMEIQKVPMNVSVVSREFIDDTNARSLMDLLRYTAAASGDTRYAMRRPGNEATPQGAFTVRGFPVNTIMRNGVFRYIAYNMDSVDRVEVVQGPAAVFFGQGYPGGVINYVTKQPVFAKIPTTFRYSINDNSGQKLTADINVPLSKRVAFRLTGGWEDTQGERRFEFRKNVNYTPSMTFVPFDSGKLKINIEAESLHESFNQNDYDWIYSDFAGWRTAALASGPKVPNTTSTPSLAYATYINNKRVATGDYALPAYTKVERGAYYTDANGNFIHDKAFNYTSRGARTTNDVSSFTATADVSPTEWLDGRYVFLHDNSRFNNIEGVTTPWGDGIHWNVGASATSGYYRLTDTHQLDLIFKFNTGGLKHKILTGYNYTTYLQNYLGNDIKFTPYYGHVPGSTNPVANPGYGTTGGTQVADNLVGEGRSHDTGPPTVNQVVRDRNGNIKLVKAVYSNFDPGFETYPTIDILFPMDRVWLDGYKPINSAAYLNYQLSAFNDRLNIIAGYRRQWQQEKGQYLEANYPWYQVPVNAWRDPANYPADAWGYGANYIQALRVYKRHGDAWMAGASFAVTNAINVYASVSKTFQFNIGNVGGVFTGNEIPVVQSALDQNGGSFQYLGQTITSVNQFVAIEKSRGAYDDLRDENGMNWELGAKISTQDSRIVGTFSVFRGERTNQMLDDPVAQSNLSEPLNYNTTLFAPGTVGYNTRVFRWRTTNLKNRIEGAQAEVIWSPLPNYQAVINGSWLWTAKTLYDKTKPMPGTPDYNAGTAAQKVAWDIYYGARIENVPEYRFNVFNKYTFSDGFARGGSVGLGMRYSSKTVVSRSVDWNPLNGGYQAGDYVVFDVTLSYPWQIFGQNIATSLGIYNATDEQYSEGSFVLSPGRNWLFSNTLSF